MHLIHKLRRSISHRPRHLLDLPDEILCLILEYCCQDLDFLLWSCPLVTLEDQFCHDCYHCTLCHGPAIRLYEQDDTSRWSNQRRRSSTIDNHRMNKFSTIGIDNGGGNNSNNSSSHQTSSDSGHNRNIYPTTNSSSSSKVTSKKRRKRVHGLIPYASDSNIGSLGNHSTTTTTITGLNSGNSLASNGRHGNGSSPKFSSSSSSSSAGNIGTRPCPRNGNRLWYEHLQQQQHQHQEASIRLPFLWRLLAPLSINRHQPQHHRYHNHLHEQQQNGGRMSSIWLSSVLLSIPTMTLDHISWISSSLLSTIRHTGRDTLGRLIQHLDGVPPETAPLQYSESAHTTGTSIGPHNILLQRRKTRGMTSPSSGTSSRVSEVPMSRTWSTTGLPRPCDNPEWDHDGDSDSATPSSENESDDECHDDYDDSIHLAAPFQFLMVSRQFADAAVQSLWRNLVFHGHDAFQTQSLLTTLYKDDDISDDLIDFTTKSRHYNHHRPSAVLGLNIFQELAEEENEEGAARSVSTNSGAAATQRISADAQTTLRSLSIGTTKPAPAPVAAIDSGTTPPFPTQGTILSGRISPSMEGEHMVDNLNNNNASNNSNNTHHSKRSWIESLNGSLKRFLRFQGGLSSNTEESSSSFSSSCGNNGSNLDCHKQHLGHRIQKRGSRLSPSSSTQSGRTESLYSNLQTLPSRPRSNRAKWPYRRYVRRVVLNFAHPQASPEMLVKVLECIGSRCRDQIHALDLHANEKMQEAGLERPEELDRLFGSGFSKLRYLRLQGGFVDNQLLCALIKGLNSPKETQQRRQGTGSDNDDQQYHNNTSLPSKHSSNLGHSILESSSLPHIPTCQLSQVFLGPGSVTNSAVEKLIAATGHCLEVFTVTSCVDVGGAALASLLTKCPKLRVLGVHRSLAQDRELLEGLGIEYEGVPGSIGHSVNALSNSNNSNNINPHQGSSSFAGFNSSSTGIDGLPTAAAVTKKPMERKKIVAPLERLELGTIKLTKIGVSEILKGTCKTLRFLVLETQHFSEQLLTEVITPFCTRLEGLYFDEPEQLQRQQQQLQGLGFSAGRRRFGECLSGRSPAPDWGFEFGRSGRTFFSDPNRPAPPQRQQQSSQSSNEGGSSPSPPPFAGSNSTAQANLAPNVSAWLGETTTEDWIRFGDCALWTCAAGPGISFENGGPASSSATTSTTGGAIYPGGFRPPTGQQRRSQQPLPLHHAYHNPSMILSKRYQQRFGSGGTATTGGGGGVGSAVVVGNDFLQPQQQQQLYQNPYNQLSFIGEYDLILARFRVTRTAVESVLESIPNLKSFTMMRMDFILESHGLSEWKTLIRQDEIWVQSWGFRLLQLFYLVLFLSTIYFGTLRG